MAIEVVVVVGVRFFFWGGEGGISCDKDVCTIMAVATNK